MRRLLAVRARVVRRAAPDAGVPAGARARGRGERARGRGAGFLDRDAPVTKACPLIAEAVGQGASLVLSPRRSWPATRTGSGAPSLGTLRHVRRRGPPVTAAQPPMVPAWRRWEAACAYLLTLTPWWRPSVNCPEWRGRRGSQA